MATHFINTKQLEKIWNAPPCSGYLRAGNSFCAEGKLYLLLGLPAQVMNLNILDNPEDYITIIQDLNKIRDKVKEKTGVSIWKINDSWIEQGITLSDSSRRAFVLGLQAGAELGIFKFETSVSLDRLDPEKTLELV